MILFLKDWATHPTAIVDTKTTNESFLKMAAKYKEAGNPNWGMILALHNPDLQGIDPHDETLDYETKLAIIEEASENIWYFLREVFYIPPKSGTIPIRYRANRGNVAIAWLAMNNLDFIHTQPRQTGKSVGMDAINIWLMFLRLFNSEISLITKDSGLREKNIARLKEMRDTLPPYMVATDRRDKNNSEALSYLAKGNHLRTSVAQASESGARKVGRGNTTPIFQIDEAPFISNIEITLASALPGGTEAKEIARDRGEPYFTAITTTAGKRDDKDGKYIYSLIEESARWNDNWFKLPDEATLREVISKAGGGRACRVYCCFSHRQLGYSDEWLLRILAETGSRGAEADRDYFNVWTNGSQRSPLSMDLNQIISKSERTPEEIEISSQGYSVRWYVSREERCQLFRERSIIMSLDTSEMVGNDDVGVIFTDAGSLATVGAATINDTDLPSIASWIAGVLLEHPTMTMIFERKSTGLSIFDLVAIHLLAAGENPFKRVFNNIVQQPELFPSEWEYIRTRKIDRSVVRQYRRHFGFVTNAENRRFLYSNILQQNAKMGGERVRDEVLIKQIMGLVEKNNRIDHVASGHDDMVIAWLLAGWLLAAGHNLDWYGINSARILHDVHVKESESDDERRERYRATRIEEEIEQVCLELANADDSIAGAQLEARLRRLVIESNRYTNQTRSIATLLETVEKQKAMKQQIERISKTSKRNGGGYRSRMAPRGTFRQPRFNRRETYEYY